MPARPETRDWFPSSFASNAILMATLHDAVEYLNGEGEIGAARIEPTTTRPLADADGLDFVDVRGHAHAKQGLEIAAALPARHEFTHQIGIARCLLGQLQVPECVVDSAFFLGMCVHLASGRGRAFRVKCLRCPLMPDMGPGLDSLGPHAAHALESLRGAARH